MLTHWLVRSLDVRRPHAVVSSDASSDRLQTQESAEDKLIIYRHYATDDQRGVTVQKQLSTLETQHAAPPALLFFYYYSAHYPTKKKKKMKETCWHFGTLHERHREAKMTHEENEWRNSHKYKPGRQLNKLIFTHTVSFFNTNVVCNDMNWN